MIAWAMQSPFLTFFIVIAALSSVTCAFKALGGGYWPRRHCPGCDCNQTAPAETEDDDD